MQFSCGGKIFILGEYACIEGGPSILGTLAPLFHLRVIADHTKEFHPLPFAEQSPAGIYLKRHREALHGMRLEWDDPYDTPIGVGSSSAQFILSVAAVAHLTGKPQSSPHEVLALYWDVVGTTQGLRPSGADVVAQWIGGPLVTRNDPFMHTALAPWKGKSVFLLAYTGTKAKTHEHLKQLQTRGFPQDFKDVMNRLNEITLLAVESWERGEDHALGSALNAFQHTLTRGGLAPLEFTAVLESIQKWPGVLGCKGSGAQGGDCALLLVEEKQALSIMDRVREELGWTPMPANWTHDGIRQS